MSLIRHLKNYPRTALTCALAGITNGSAIAAYYLGRPVYGVALCLLFGAYFCLGAGIVYGQERRGEHRGLAPNDNSCLENRID